MPFIFFFPFALALFVDRFFDRFDVPLVDLLARRMRFFEPFREPCSLRINVCVAGVC